ncbi:MAG: AmmeMemoRadiSam system protein B [Balneolaceae bacterium]|nr:MAG: AmmeMemoRadiSam system protein B [Balneolaceae bacterium]
MESDPLNGDFLTGAVPEIRRDIDIIPVEQNGTSLLYFLDSMGYMPADFALDRSVEPLLNLITGTISINQMASLLKGQISVDDLHAFIHLLDKHSALQSENFTKRKNEIESDFESMDERLPSLAGISYSEHPDLFNQQTHEILSLNRSEPVKQAKALYAPHIDLRVGASVYAQSFSLLKGLKPKRVIILATAHYAGFFPELYADTPFIGSNKMFQLPGRSFPVDAAATNELIKNNTVNGFTLNDRAHRIEHSIEMHLIFLSAIWKHDFTILPILVTGFDDLFYMPNGNLKEKIDSFSSQLKELNDEDTFFLISGDLSHVGKKFGDKKTADKMRGSVEKYDHAFLEFASDGNPSGILSHLSKSFDETRICGFPPLYLYLNTFPDKKGEIINYHWWDEHERESAVSFGSILF